MGRFDKLKKQNEVAIANVKEDVNKLYAVAEESKRVSNIAHNAGEIITDLDKQFAKATGLDGKDVAFLFLAVALQCTRWVLQPSMDLNFEQTPKSERMDAGEGKKIEQQSQKEYFNKKNQWDKSKTSEHYFTWEEIIRAPVPYDAMEGTQSIVIPGVTGFGKNINGVNHHTATWGHDPVLGWVIGTMNIISRTITFTNWQTRYVALEQGIIVKGAHLAKEKQIVLPWECSIFDMFGDCISSVSEDSRRIFAALARQAMHQASDKYTKNGLQIPLISPEKAQMLLNKGWNSVEAEKLINQIGENLAIIGIQVQLSVFINLIIRALHLLFYDEKGNLSFEQYEVKTRKILSYSNVIAVSSNIIGVSAAAIATENIEILNKLDIGGLIVTIHRLISDHNFIQKVKQEFLEKGWYNLVMGEDYNF